MQYFTEQGTSHLEVVNRIKEKYGERAQIMTHRNIRVGGFLGFFKREGVEITGILSNERQLRRKKELEDEKNRIISLAKGAVPEISPVEPAGRQTGNSGDSVKPETGSMGLVLSELKEIKEKMAGRELDKSDHPSIEKIEELLVKNDFSHGFIKKMMKKTRSELSLQELDDFEFVSQRVVEWIGGEIELYDEELTRKHRRVVLIGPTGVGKTTTIAKLAAMSILDKEEKDIPSVRMITIDNYRIGARGQLETYGDIMNIPVASVETKEEMQKKLALFEDIDIIYIDTTGRSQNDYKNIASMRELLEPCGNRAEYFLAVSATTKASDIEEIFREFEPFNYRGVVLTKLDETMRIGNIISTLSETEKPLAYITFGQGVPADIEQAGRLKLLKHLEGFSVDIEKLKAKFGE